MMPHCHLTMKQILSSVLSFRLLSTVLFVHLCFGEFLSWRLNGVLVLKVSPDLIWTSSILYSPRRQWHPTPVLLPGKAHGRRSLVGCSPWHRKESDTTKWLQFHFWLSRIGEGNGNPLQCSCLENPRDGGAWWAAIYGVAQSRTRLKQLSSSSNPFDTSTFRIWNPPLSSSSVSA